MKKIFLTTAITILATFFFSANAGNTRMDKETRKQLRKERREKRREEWLHSVNSMTENQFYSDFPDAKNVSWTEGVFSEATFDDGDVLKTAYYDSDDKLVGTTTRANFSDLPAGAQQFIAKKYPGYSVEKVILFDDNEANNTDMFLFDSAFADEDIYFPVMVKDSKQIILKVTMDGNVSFLQNYK